MDHPKQDPQATWHQSRLTCCPGKIVLYTVSHYNDPYSETSMMERHKGCTLLNGLNNTTGDELEQSRPRLVNK